MTANSGNSIQLCNFYYNGLSKSLIVIPRSIESRFTKEIEFIGYLIALLLFTIFLYHVN